ncbi:hypothetical protein MVUOKPPV_CDS0310 [Klebsiella phage phi1_175008]|uniref:Uncharacterized protein n=1 Tax=Klebsiella phage phi1_175008 TaxID=3127744 RepID=A0ACD5FRP8_9CAUD
MIYLIGLTLQTIQPTNKIPFQIGRTKRPFFLPII